MRIAIASPPLIPTPPPGMGYGGLERLAWDLAEELGRRHEVVLIAGEGSNAHWVVPRGFESSPDTGLLESISASLADGCDALIDMTHTKLFAQTAHRVAHGSDRRLRCGMVRSYSFWTDRAGVNPVYPSRAVSYLMSGSGYTCGASDSHIIYPGIDLSGYRSSSKEDYFVYFGRIIPEKAVERSILVAYEAGVRLLVAGHTGIFSYDRSYVDMIRGMCRGRVEWLGEISHEEKIELLSHARGMIFMPRWVESFGIAVAEALASGCPCIVGGAGGHTEQVEDGVNGYVVRNLREAVEAVKRVAGGEIDPERCVKSAEKFSRTVMAARWESLLQGGGDA